MRLRSPGETFSHVIMRLAAQNPMRRLGAYARQRLRRQRDGEDVSGTIL
jgi:hypothetical protein